MSNWRKFALPMGLMLAGLVLVIGYVLNQGRHSQKPTAETIGLMNGLDQSTPTPEPVLPTRSLAAVPPVEEPATLVAPNPSPTHTTVASATGAASSTPTDLGAPTAAPPLVVSPPESSVGLSDIDYLSRFGLSGSLGAVEPAQAAGLLFGSFYNWGIATGPVDLPGISFWQTVRVSQDGVRVSWSDIAAAAAANPGSVWMIGNEPDVIWQDNVTPERYASLYHEAYTFIKSRDPSALIANGAVAMPTPLRRAYLDRILDTYLAQYGQSMPIDIWNIHAYILREEAGSWGVEIPPGMDAFQHLGRQYGIADHDDIETFRQNLLEFRAWMAARGYGERPLAVTEFGVLMPADYGFSQEAYGRFMREAVAFMATAANEAGYAADGGRLVQWWFWFSLHDTVGQYHVADLYDPELDRLTYLGQVWSDLAQER